MDPVDKDTLRSHQVDLINDLEPRDILGHLYEDEVITENDVELIDKGKTRRERCQSLLFLLPRRGPTAYGCFRKALQETSYTHLSDQLHVMRNHPSNDYFWEKAESSTRCTCLSFITNQEEIPHALMDFLRKHCCLLFNNVEPKEITAYLYQNHLLSDEDCERIHGHVTRQDRCRCLLSILSKGNPEQTISIVIQSLEKKYRFIVEEMISSTKGSEEPVSATTVLRDEASSAAVSSSSACHMNPVEVSLQKATISPSTVGEQALHTELAVSEKNTNCQNSYPILLTPGSFKPFTLPNKKLVLAFNHLSSLINQGKYDTFERASVQLDLKYYDNADMSCLLAYLSASRWLFGNKMDKAKGEIKRGLVLVPKTSNPKYFTVELFTAKTRMYVSQMKLNKLDSVLEDIKQVVETDPIGCTGRAAGWLYMNDGRGKASQMDLINVSNPNGIKAYNILFNSAKSSLLKALANFNEDGGKDGPFGCGFALCRLAILLLRCGDNGLSMDTLVPPEDDIQCAGVYLKNLEESSIPIPKTLEVSLLIAKCDFYYRKGNNVRALEKATAAYQLAKEVRMMDVRDHAQNRRQFLKLRTTFITNFDNTEADHENIMKELLTDIENKDNSDDV